MALRFDRFLKVARPETTDFHGNVLWRHQNYHFRRGDGGSTSIVTQAAEFTSPQREMCWNGLAKVSSVFVKDFNDLSPFHLVALSFCGAALCPIPQGCAARAACRNQRIPWKGAAETSELSFSSRGAGLPFSSPKQRNLQFHNGRCVGTAWLKFPQFS